MYLLYAGCLLAASYLRHKRFTNKSFVDLSPWIGAKESKALFLHSGEREYTGGTIVLVLLCVTLAIYNLGGIGVTAKFIRESMSAVSSSLEFIELAKRTKEGRKSG